MTARHSRTCSLVPEPHVFFDLERKAYGVRITCPCRAVLFALKKRWPIFVEAQDAAQNVTRLASPGLNPLARVPYRPRPA